MRTRFRPKSINLGPMQWRDLSRGRGEIAPHHADGSRDSDRASAFDAEKYPGLAEAAMHGLMQQRRISGHADALRGG